MSFEKPDPRKFESHQQPADDDTYELAWDPDDDTDDKDVAADKEVAARNDDDTYALNTTSDDTPAANTAAPTQPSDTERYTPTEPPGKTRETSRAGEHTANERASSKEQNEDIERLLEDIGKRGRMTASTTGVTGKLAKERAVRGRFPHINDNKSISHDLQRLRPKDSYKTYPQLPPTQVLEKNNINAITMLQPLTETEPRYEKREQVTRSGGIFRKEKRELQDTKVDEIEKPISISRYNNDENDDADAYCLYYYLTGDEERNFLNPATKHVDSEIKANLVLPEKDAKEVYEQLQQNPDLARRVIRAIDPDFMDEMEEYMPDHRNVLMVPEGKHPEDILQEENARNRTEATIDQQYIISTDEAETNTS